MVRYIDCPAKMYSLTNQIFRSGTAVGALVREAEFAQSPSDFVNKLHIALKECNETFYWLNLLYDTSCAKCDNEEIYIIIDRLNNAIADEKGSDTYKVLLCESIFLNNPSFSSIFNNSFVESDKFLESETL